MSDRLITTTSTEGLQTLGSAAQRSFELITSTLRSRIGDDAALIFAEPVATAQGASTEWYTERPGLPVRLADLSSEDAERVRTAAGQAMARVLSLAEELAAQKTEHGFWLAEALRNATALPDDGALWAMRTAEGALHPVVVNWGRQPDERGRVRGVLTAVAPKPARAAVAVRAASAVKVASSEGAADIPAEGTSVRAGYGARGMVAWLLGFGWLLLALLIALILWLMIAPCGLLPVSLSHCGRSAAASAPFEGLTAEILQLEARLSDADRACVAARPRSVVGISPEPPLGMDPALTDPDEVERRLADRGMEQGDGALVVSLAWNSVDDLDLRVECPAGEIVDFRKSSAAWSGSCEGALDVDANFPPGLAVEDPVENATFLRAVPGVYRVIVRFAADREPKGPQEFGIFVRRNGQLVDAFGTSGRVEEGSTWSREIEFAE